MWDYLFRGDEIFPVLETELVERFPDVEIVGYDVFGNTHGADEGDGRGTPERAVVAPHRRRGVGDGVLRQLHARRDAGIHRS